jgi:hypothetical protein
MRACRTVQEHWFCACDRHIERTDVRLPILERNVATMYAILHGCTGCVGGRLRHRVVAVRELKLQDVADGSNDRVRHESILRATNNDWNYLIGAAERTS